MTGLPPLALGSHRSRAGLTGVVAVISRSSRSTVKAGDVYDRDFPLQPRFYLLRWLQLYDNILSLWAFNKAITENLDRG